VNPRMTIEGRQQERADTLVIARTPRAASLRTGVAMLGGVAALLVIGVPAGFGMRSDLPNPCQIVPTSLIASALGTKKAPPGTASAVTNVSTCNYTGKLTISVGYTALTNPAPAVTEKAVPGLPHGTYEAFAGSTQTEVTFFEGTAASGVYGVVRNYVKIPKAKLVKIAVALSKGTASLGGAAPGGSLVP
jgi:hypothetical protein